MAYQRFGTREVLFKIETTEGTDAVPTAAANAFLTFNAAIEWQADSAKRMADKPYFTAEDEIETGDRIKLSFEADLLGNSAVGTSSPISPIIQCCGFAEVLVATTSSTFNPLTSGIPSASFYFYQGDKQFKVTGARGDMQIERSPSNFGKATFTFTGMVDGTVSPIQGAAPTPTLTAFRAAPVITPANWVVSANGVNVECVKHALNLGNSVNYIPTSENGRVMITDRKPSGTLSILLPDITSFNPWLLAQNRTRIVVADTLTGGASLNSAINLPTVQLLKPKKFTDMKGGIQVDIPYVPYPTSGNDELNIVFT